MAFKSDGPDVRRQMVDNSRKRMKTLNQKMLCTASPMLRYKFDETSQRRKLNQKQGRIQRSGIREDVWNRPIGNDQKDLSAICRRTSGPLDASLRLTYFRPFVVGRFQTSSRISNCSWSDGFQMSSRIPDRWMSLRLNQFVCVVGTSPQIPNGWTFGLAVYEHH